MKAVCFYMLVIVKDRLSNLSTAEWAASLVMRALKASSLAVKRNDPFRTNCQCSLYDRVQIQAELSVLQQNISGHCVSRQSHKFAQPHG
jgi:hypothetical protein